MASLESYVHTGLVHGTCRLRSSFFASPIQYLCVLTCMHCTGLIGLCSEEVLELMAEDYPQKYQEYIAVVQEREFQATLRRKMMESKRMALLVRVIITYIYAFCNRFICICLAVHYTHLYYSAWVRQRHAMCSCTINHRGVLKFQFRVVLVHCSKSLHWSEVTRDTPPWRVVHCLYTPTVE